MVHCWHQPVRNSFPVTKPCFRIFNKLTCHKFIYRILWKFPHQHSSFNHAPCLLARRWRAFLSPRRDAWRCTFLSVISFLISLFRVSTAAENTRSPSCVRTAAPIFVLPGSSARVIGCNTALFSYKRRMVNGTVSTILLSQI